MIHTIHTNEMKKKKDKMSYLLNNCNFLHDYYSDKKKVNNFFDKVVSAPDRQRQRFMMNTNNTPEIETESETCCGKLRKIDDGFLVCRICGIQKPFTEYSRTYEEQFVPIYSKLSHFKKIIRQLHGVENFKIHKLNEIKDYITKYKITDLSVDSIKNILKRLRFASYYDHVQLIRLHLDCLVIPIEPALEDELVRLFTCVENQYPLISNRNNFFNYNYLLNKFFIHLDRREFIPYLTTIKGTDKLSDLDKLFRLVQL